MGSVAPPKNRPSITDLRGRAVAAVLVLVVLAGCAIALVLWGQSALVERSRLIDMAGTQRMLIQRIALLAERHDSQSVAQDLSALRVRLRQEVRAMRAEPALPAGVAALYAIAWDGETGVMIRFDQAVQAVLDGTGAADAVNHREAMLFGEEVARQLRVRPSLGGDMALRVCGGLAVLAVIGTAGLYFLLVAPLRGRIRQQGGLHAALSDAITQSGHGVLMLDGLGQVTYANSHAGLILGHGVGLTNLSLGQLVFSTLGEDSAQAILDQAAGQSWHGDVRMVQNNGAVFWAEMVVSAAAAEGGFLVLFFDATPRRDAEAKLRQARERLAAAIDAVDDGFALYDADERLLSCNRIYAGILPGLEAWVTPGSSYEELLSHAWTLGMVRTDKTREDFVSEALIQFRAADSMREVTLHDGRSLRVCERRTPEGGRVVVVSDVTEHRLGRERLSQALDQAEAANRAKAVFLSSVSHELRTPLNTILGFAQLLDATPEGVFGAKQRRSVDKILRSGQALATLVDQVLDLSHLQAGQVSLDMGACDLGAVVGECVEVQQGRLERQRVRLQIKGAETPCAVQADRERLAQVISVLLSNAVQYTPEGGDITLSVESAGPGRVRLAVADTGPGLTPEQQRRLFSAFDRLGAENSTTAGIGIGLTIARTLVELMGGAIGVSSREGQGSTFWIDLDAASSAPPATTGHMLIIDDAVTSRPLVAALARSQPGLKVEVVENGEAGVERAIGAASFDLILVDLDLPGMDGVEVCRRLRHSPATRFVPVVATAGAQTAPNAAEISALGFDAMLAHPWDMAQTQEMLRRFCPAMPASAHL